MSNISTEVLEAAGEMLTGMMKIHQEKLDKAYLRSENSLTIDLKAKFKPAEGDHIEVETSINFVTDRVKTSFSRVIDEKQGDMFKGEGTTEKQKKEKKKKENEPEQQALSPVRPELPSGEKEGPIDGEVVDAEFTSGE